MPYFVIKKDCANNIYDYEDFEVEILEFKTKDSAENYLDFSMDTQTGKSLIS